MDKKKRKSYPSGKKWKQDNKEKMQLYRDRDNFGCDSSEVLERDNFQCQKCGFTQEQHIIAFARRLDIHHIDFKGENVPKEERNNDPDNLVTLCIRCHRTIHNKHKAEEKWGDLIRQDSSDWQYPEIRRLIEVEIKNGMRVQEAKRKVSKDTGMGFSSIDHRYYMKKNDLLGGLGE